MRTTIFLLCLACLCMTARAEELGASPSSMETSGISVVGSASCKIKPSTVEISASLSADAELANDARVKVRDAKQRVVDALEAKSLGVAIESRGISVVPLADPNVAAMQRQQQVLIQNGVVVQVPQNQVDVVRRIGVIEQVRLVLKDVDQIEPPKLVETVLRVIDAAREGGLKIGQSDATINGYTSVQSLPTGPLITCKARNSAAMREQAYKAALDDARQKASRLAELAGMKIGKIVAIHELDGGATDAVPVADKESDLTSNLLGEMSLNVKLDVLFEIAK